MRIQSVYLAHNFKAREFLPQIVKELEDNGITCTSRWIFDDEHVKANSAEANAISDCEDIDEADALVLFVDQYGERPGRGKWFEFGYAVARDIPVFLVGNDKGCVFVNLPESWCVYKHKEWIDCLQALMDWGSIL